MVRMNIGTKIIGGDHPCFIIAEAGVNHNGSLDIAKKLVDVAREANVDAIKFQTFRTEEVIIEGIAKASYQKKTTNADESQTAMLKRLEIDKDFHLEVMKYCKEQGVLFLSTCSEEKSLDLLIELDLPVLKIASMDTANPMFLEKVAQKGKPVILSTGMSSEDEIQAAYKCLKDNGCEAIALLKCTSNYPTAAKEVNLKAMETMQKSFDAIIGFSDHTPGIGASPYAVAMGAKIIEKHFTVDKNLEGPDHKASLSPQELVAFVHEIRKVEEMLGCSHIRPTESEMETRVALRRSLVTKKDCKKGDKIAREHIAAKRTGGIGISSVEFYKALGQTLNCDLSKDQPIHWSQLGT